MQATGLEITTEALLEEPAERVFKELGFAPTDLLRQRLGRVVRHRMKAVGVLTWGLTWPTWRAQAGPNLPDSSRH